MKKLIVPVLVFSLFIAVGCSQNDPNILTENSPNVGGWHAVDGSGSDTPPPVSYETVWPTQNFSATSTHEYGFWKSRRSDEPDVTWTETQARNSASMFVDPIYNKLKAIVKNVCIANAGGQGILRDYGAGKTTASYGGTSGTATSTKIGSFACEEVKDGYNVRQSYCASLENNPLAYHAVFGMDNINGAEPIGRTDYLMRSDGHPEFSLAERITGTWLSTPNPFLDEMVNLVQNYCIMNGGHFHSLDSFNAPIGFWYVPQPDGLGDSLTPKGRTGIFYTCCKAPGWI